MMKSFIGFIYIFPLIINILIIFLMTIPSKLNKFHPMSLLIALILLTFLISLKMNFIFSSWMSYILFLVMIGGLMVIFMYITSLINNELFFINLNLMKLNLKKIFFFLMLILTIYIFLDNMIYFNLNLNYSHNMYLLNQDNMNLLYKKFYNKSTLFMMLYLYYSMMIIMYMCSNLKSPLRQIMN